MKSKVFLEGGALLAEHMRGNPTLAMAGKMSNYSKGIKTPVQQGMITIILFHNANSVIGLTEMTMNLTTEGVSMQWQTLVR